MKNTKFLKATALILAVFLTFGGGVLMVGAQEGSSSTTDITTSDIRELLNAISYNEYIGEHSDVPRATEEITIPGVDGVFRLKDGSAPAADAESDTVAHKATYDGREGLYLPSNGKVTWTLDGITEAKRYNLVIEYYPVENKSASIERIFSVNGSVPFAEARAMTISKIWKNVYPSGKFEVPAKESASDYLAKAAGMGITAEAKEENGKTYIIYNMPDHWDSDISSLVDEQTIRFFTEDIDLNEIRSSLVQAPEWTTYAFKDANGFLQTPFEFVIEPGEDGKTTIALEAVNEPIVISEIRLVPPEDNISYEEYSARYANKPKGEGKVKIEAEYFSAASSQTIYPISDTTSAINSPVSTGRTILNTVGGDKWQSSGQWIEYRFEVDKSGMYQIAARFKQSILDGMYTSRILSLYSEKGALNEGDDGYYNGVPFEEAARLQFNYDSSWQSGYLTDGKTDFSFYFEEGVVYTLRLEVSLGTMGDIVRRVQESLDSINKDYLNILKLTGPSPDEVRDYGFSRVMPDTMIDMIQQSTNLNNVAAELASIANVKSSMTATLEKVARLLGEMGRDDDNVAKNLEQLKTYIGSLGTWLSDAKTQPLTLDFLVIQNEDEKVPKANANFWQAFVHEISSFFKSFFRNYNRMGAMTEEDAEEVVEVWLAYGRDQSQVIRSLINNDFTPQSGISINLKLVAGSTLLPSILSQMGPDVYIGLGQSDVINYAIRGALVEIEDMDGFDETLVDFNEAAMMVLGIEDANRDLHYYGLPETQNFQMMFVREDILAELNIDIPKTWDDVKAAIPILQANNMQIAMHNDCKIFLYQKGGELFADNGMRINLDSNVALDAFETMCDMFTMYSFPYKYDFANRFRTGEMPIGFATYTATYNQLKVFATEIEGMWGFYPLPGYEDADGNINNVSVSTVSAIVMITGCEDERGAWEFMKWHVGAQCQIDYSNEMVAILGPSAKHATANMSALERMPWPPEEYEQLARQFNSLASVPNYPGSYIIDRYTKFAFLSAFNDGANPVTELQKYITTINKEITRKRSEFGLETLDYVGQTLAEKRMLQAETELKDVRKSSSYSASYDETCNNVEKLIAGYTTEDYASLLSLADALEELDSGLFRNVVTYMREAAAALKTYEAYK